MCLVDWSDEFDCGCSWISLTMWVSVLYCLWFVEGCDLEVMFYVVYFA